MQEGAGVREVIEDELRALGVKDLDVRIELGLQESIVSAVRAGYGVAFISRAAIEDDLSTRRLSESRLVGLEAEREIWLVRAAGRSETRAAREFVEFARGQLV
jgi:DNA-binding transcriptional LysR family regulator